MDLDANENWIWIPGNACTSNYRLFENIKTNLNIWYGLFNRTISEKYILSRSNLNTLSFLCPVFKSPFEYLYLFSTSNPSAWLWGTILHVCIPLNNLRYHTVGLNSRKASGKHVKRSEKVLKTSSEKYLLAIWRRPRKLFWFCHCWYFYADIVEEYNTCSEIWFYILQK